MSDEPTKPAGDGAAGGGEGAGAGDSEAKTPAEGQAPAEADAEAKAAAAKAKAEAAAKAKAAREAAEAAKPAWEKLPEEPAESEAADDPLVEALRREHGEAISEPILCAGDLRLRVTPEAIRSVCESLKRDHGYKLFEDLCGVHYPGREEGELEVVYHLFNLDESRRLRLKVAVGEEERVPSVAGVYRAADWLEREAWDMYGIRFDDHPDMTRILLWEGFNGHPLRKDFPIEGIDTGSAIYPEYYDDSTGPVRGTGTGWRPQPPPEPAADGEEG